MLLKAAAIITGREYEDITTSLVRLAYFRLPPLLRFNTEMVVTPSQFVNSVTH